MFSQLNEFWWQFLLLGISCYLFGSINYSIIFSRLIKKDDIRKHGSGNAGTTNMFRVYGFLMSLATFLCDSLKGVVACLVSKAIFSNFCQDDGVFASYFAGVFVVLGHVLPVFFSMRGGKGFATSVGICFTTQPILALCMVLPLLAIIFLSDRMSVAALSFVAFLTAWHWIFYLPIVGIESCIAISIVFLIVAIAHKDNIFRIFNGKELPTGVRKIFLKRK